MTEKDFSTINWARTYRKWVNEGIGAIIYFLVNIMEIVFYTLIAALEVWIVQQFHLDTIWVFCLWVGTILAMGNCILRKLKNLPEDIELERKDKEKTEQTEIDL